MTSRGTATTSVTQSLPNHVALIHSTSWYCLLEDQSEHGLKDHERCERCCKGLYRRLHLVSHVARQPLQPPSDSMRSKSDAGGADPLFVLPAISAASKQAGESIAAGDFFAMGVKIRGGT